MPRKNSRKVKNKRKKRSAVGYNDWSGKGVDFCNNIVAQCTGYVYMYELMIRKYKKISERLNIVSGIMGAVIASIGLITINNTTISKWINITTAVIGIFISILSVCSTVWKLNENLTNSINAFTAFKNIMTEIKMQLSIPEIKRCNAIEFMGTISNTYASIQANLPVIDESIKDKYMRSFPKNPIYNMQEIIVSSDSSDSTPGDSPASSSDRNRSHIMEAIRKIQSDPIIADNRNTPLFQDIRHEHSRVR